jgi:uncharacterized protein (DUF1501 family)
MRRRQFLTQAGIASLASLGLQGWAARTTQAATGQRSPRLVVVLLRGAADGLNIVVPYQDRDYYQARPRLALPPPDQPAGVLDLDGQFGLHPSLAGLLPFWQKQQLAFVQACGSPDPSRSHFEAQDYLENGGSKADRMGWMNRLLTQLQQRQGSRRPATAVSLRQTPPLILRGSHPVVNLGLDNQSLQPLPIDEPTVRAAFDPLYQGSDPISRAYREGKLARENLRTALAAELAERENQIANNGAPQAALFATATQRLGRLMAQDPQMQLAFLDVAGWDTHVNQPIRLSQQLRLLGQGLQGFTQALGPAYPETIIVVVSEFGRTVQENGNRGTDHGHGNVLWLLGGGLAQTTLVGGKVHGQWPGLATSQLYEGRDLQVTTDFRMVLGKVIREHLRLPNAALTAIFPGYG